MTIRNQGVNHQYHRMHLGNEESQETLIMRNSRYTQDK